MTTEQLTAIMTECATKSRRHKDYERTVKLAVFYNQIITGRGQSDLVISYKPSEDAEQKDQRVAVTKSKTPSICSQVMSQFEHVKSAPRISDSVAYMGETDRATDLAQLNSTISRFRGKQTLQQYIEEKEKHYAGLDPNAWLVIQTNEAGEITPVCFSAASALDFSVKGGVTDYLVTAGVLGDKKTFFGYMTGFIIAFLPQGSPFNSSVTPTLTNLNGENYAVYILPNTTTETPATRFGYIPDDMSEGRTFVGIMEPASEEFKDLINQKSELDLSMALHTYPEKMQYVSQCVYKNPENPIIKCNGGALTHGNGACPKCRGTGYSMHASTQDVQLIVMPKSEDGKPAAMPLADMVHYPQKPLEIVKLQIERCQQIPKEIPIAIFGVDLNTRANGLKTATEINNFYDSLYVNICPYADKISELYKFSVHAVAQWKGIDNNLSVSHKYPRRFKMETLGELLILLKDANASGASSDIIWGIASQIYELQNQDNPQAIELAKVKHRLRPFKQLNDAERMLELSTLPPDNQYKVLYNYLDLIFDQVLQENPLFLDFDQADQDRVVMEKVEAIRSQFAPQLPTFE